MAKYIIELEQIKGTDSYRAKGANTLVFDENGIKNILTPFEEPKEEEVDWSKVATDTPILVRNSETCTWKKRYFARYEFGRVLAWSGGCTSWTSNNDNDWSSWKYAKLAEE